MPTFNILVPGLDEALGAKAPTASLGTAAFQPTSAFATAAQGIKADTALQPGDLAGKANLASPALTGTPTINGVPIPVGGAVLSCPVNNTVLSTATGIVYTSPGNNATPLSITSEGIVSFPCPRAGILRNLFVRTGTTAVTNTAVTVITVRKNGADTTLTVTMTQTTVTTTSDTTHTVSVAQGDLITLSLVTTGVLAVSTSIAAISFEVG